jgi:hypothetical protein
MQEILFDYKLNPTTWAYVSALMMIGIYFKFRRFWSVRNLDLAALIGFSPGFLLVYHGLSKQGLDPVQARELVQAGYVWLFAVGGFFLFRLLLDPVMVRRPLLEPNLSASGLTFTGAALLVFLMANVITNPPERLENLLNKQEAAAREKEAAARKSEAAAPTAAPAKPAAQDKQETPPPNPGLAAFHQFADFCNRATIPAANQARPEAYRDGLIRLAASRAAIILAHLLVVAGMVWIGFRHFDNIHAGVAAATLYLLTFYTSQLTRQIEHVAPAALLVWAVAAYRRPMVAGLLLGLAGGLIYYPLFLLPLWCGFYWRRGLARFALGVAIALAALVGWLALSSPDVASLAGEARQMFGWRDPFQVTATGFWRCYDQTYRIPVLTAFVALSLGLAIWPAQKNLGTLLSCSAAVMLGTQFWHAQQGGLSMAWYLPLLILTIFRPNLEDRVALSAVRPTWGRRRKG